MSPWRALQFIVALALTASSGLAAAEVRVAVATNFSETITAIADRFESVTGHRLVIVSGSTGKHYAQIKNGAPLDVFLAADSERPRRLEEEGLAVAGSRFTYTTGRLVLWSPRENFVDPSGRRLASGNYRYLAIANPRLAPYGRAAREILESRGLWELLQDKLVRGENIGQAYQFVASGNAELGFIALSQITRPGRPIPGSYWQVPGELYTPIEQQAVLLRETEAARAFMEYLKDDDVRAIIQAHGYITPGSTGAD